MGAAGAYFEYRGARIWYAIRGKLDPTRPPLVCIPGGPGLAHDYLQAFEALTARDRAVVFYDPIGAGRSGRPADIDWTLDLYLDELFSLREVLGVRRLHLLGSSSGGMLALLYALARPRELGSIILSSATASVPAYQASVRRSIERMPTEIADVLLDLDRRSTTAFAIGYFQWVRRHICRVPWTEDLARCLREVNRDAYDTMKGDPLCYLGTLADFDITDRLAEITVPGLFLCGRHDALELALCQRWRDQMPDCELTVLEDSSHVPYIEQPARCMQIVGDFLDRVDDEYTTNDSYAETEH